jgi:hypothetical protein
MSLRDISEAAHMEFFILRRLDWSLAGQVLNDADGFIELSL